MTALTRRMPPKAAALAAGASAAVMLAMLLSAPALAEEPFSPRFADRAAFDRFVDEGRASPFGLDYAFIHNPGARDRDLVDGCCGKVALRWVNFARVEWGVIEKRPPKDGKHTYDWSDLDGAVKAWQRNGIHIMMSLRFFSPWATAPRNDSEFVYLKGLAKWFALKGADYLPKPEHVDDLRRYVRSLVERYDGDGVDDMPGLLFPVLHYQVGNEYSNELFWAGTVQQYGRLLREFAGAARSACAQVKIILSGIGFEEVYGFYGVGMDPRTEAHLKKNLPRVPAGMWDFVRRTDRCTVQDGRQVLVAFQDDHVGQNHDEPTGELSAEIPVPGPHARITHLITAIDRTEPKVEQADADHGVLRLCLGEYPIFIELPQGGTIAAPAHHGVLTPF